MRPPSPLLILLLAVVTCTGRAAGQAADAQPSGCHVYIGYELIWTFEMVSGTPVLNIVSFVEGEWMLRPEQILIQGRDQRRRGARIRRFSIDTGVPGDPYNVNFLRVQGNSFIGLDLLGDFSNYQTPASVKIDLGNHRYELQPVDCLDFEMLVEKISRVNFNSPDIREDFRVLKIEVMGRRVPRPRR